jgi:LacI family transcriptional regulator
MPSLIDVAKIAGVGVMSVSRVVNGTRKVSPETERKVRAAIERIGYEPNEAARVLKGQRSHVLGLIFPDLADPFFAICANSVQETARAAGYVTWIAATGHREDVERDVAKVMAQRNVAGLIVVPCGKQNDHFASVAKRGIPMVSIDRPLENIEATSLVVDNRAAAAKATEHLIEHGHRSILCITDDFPIYTRMERVAGYSQAMKRAKLPVQVCPVGSLSGGLSDQLSFALNSSTPPTAIFVGSDLIALYTLHELQRRSISMPDEMAVIAFDDFDAATLVQPAITVIRQPVAELGKQATTLLCSQIDNPESSKAAKLTLKTEFVIRESCGCRSAGVARTRPDIRGRDLRMSSAG